MNTNTNEVVKQNLDAEKKFFANKTRGFAIGYLAALRHVVKAGHMPTEEQVDKLSKAAYACGLLTSSKKNQNPLV